MQRPACTFKRYFFSFIFIVFFIVFFLFFCFGFVQDPGDEPRYLLIRHTKKGPLTFIDSLYQKGTFEHLLIHHTKKAPFNIYWFIISKGTIDLAHEHLFFLFFILWFLVRVLVMSRTIHYWFVIPKRHRWLGPCSMILSSLPWQSSSIVY